ncbi:MAG TPA: hypothetical protein VFY89_02935 [Ktedonobacterales bacterium]
MAMSGRVRASAASAAAHVRAQNGSVRSCIPYAGEISRHRVMSADGHDLVVATMRHQDERQARFVTAAYPVQHGYLVMIRQPLCELRATEAEAAREHHEQLVRVLAEAGLRVVRARRALAARQRAELRDQQAETPLGAEAAADDAAVLVAAALA